jgi:hypothetical protein
VLNGNFQFTNIDIEAGVPWLIPSGITIRATGTVTIANNAIFVIRTPADNGRGISVRPPSGAGAGNAMNVGSLAAIAGLTPGLGGGVGGGPPDGCAALGGAAIAIYAQGGIVLNGSSTIEASGNNTSIGCGGGGGGVILLASEGNIVLAGAAILDVRGGAGGDGSNFGGLNFGGGGGGGGLVHIFSPNASNTTDIPAGRILLAGGTGGATIGSGSPSSGYGGGASAGIGGLGGVDGSNFAFPGEPGRVFRTQTANPAMIIR